MCFSANADVAPRRISAAAIANLFNMAAPP
jgi:hypothetical protein